MEAIPSPCSPEPGLAGETLRLQQDAAGQPEARVDAVLKGAVQSAPRVC